MRRSRGHTRNGLAKGSGASQPPEKVESVRESRGLRCKGRELGNGQAGPGQRLGRRVGCWATSDCSWARVVYFSALPVLGAQESGGFRSQTLNRQ